MAEYKNAVLTHAGAELIAEAIAGQFAIEFVKMVIGDGEYEEEEKTREALQKRTELKNLRNAVNFSSVTPTDDRSVKLKAVITNEKLEAGYRMTEIGIIAKRQGDTVSGEVLYSVAVAIEADYLPDADYPISYTQEYYTHVSNSENVVIKVDGTFESVLHPKYEEAEELDDLEEGDDLLKILGKIKKAISELIRHKKLLGDEDISKIGDGTVTGAIASLKKSVRNGKELVADAITAKGVETAADATFQQMAENIEAIVQGQGDATDADVLVGKTFSNDEGGPFEGTMPNNGAFIQNPTTATKVMIPKGYHNGEGYVDTTGAYTAGQSVPSITSQSLTKNTVFGTLAYFDFVFSFPHKVVGVTALSTTKDKLTGDNPDTYATLISISGNTVRVACFGTGYQNFDTSVTAVGY